MESINYINILYNLKNVYTIECKLRTDWMSTKLNHYFKIALTDFELVLNSSELNAWTVYIIENKL